MFSFLVQTFAINMTTNTCTALDD